MPRRYKFRYVCQDTTPHTLEKMLGVQASFLRFSNIRFPLDRLSPRSPSKRFRMRQNT